MSNLSPNEAITIPDFSNRAERALNYPYPAPDFSYTIEEGCARQFLPEDKGDRTALLCIGSNISPMQLKHKFGSRCSLPVQRAWLLDHDVVFSNRFSDYGALPAILLPSAGTLCFLAIAWLNQEQMELMDASEKGGYEREILPSATLRTQEGEEFSEIAYYKSTFSPFLLNDAPVAIHDILAENRQYNALTTAEIFAHFFQELVKTFPLHSFDDFIDSLAGNPNFRAEIQRRFL